jgi:hypothetical protein
VEDNEFRGMVWSKWKTFREGQPGNSGSCAVCREMIEDVDVSQAIHTLAD